MQTQAIQVNQIGTTEFTSCLKNKTGIKPSKSFIDQAISDLVRRESGIGTTPVAISKHEFDRLLWKL